MGQEIPKQTIRRLHRDLESAKECGLKKSKVMEDYADDLGISTSALYRRLRKLRGKQKSGGGRKRSVPRDLVRAVYKLKERGKEAGRVDQERELSTEEAQKILQRNGWEGATDYSASQINAIARKELGYRRTGRVQRFQADYATQVYLMDFSRLKYFQVFDEDENGNYLLKTTRRSMAYKDPHGAFRAWVVLLVDDHSRMSIGHIFATTGEDPRLGLRFLTWVFSREKDEHVMRYAPETLQMDAGAFDAEVSRRALRACEIEPEGGFSKHSQGKVERAIRSLWQRWELPLAVDKPEGWTITMPDLNELLHEHLLREGRRPHPMQRRHSREEMYASSLPGHARTLEGVDLTALAYSTVTRKVTREGIVSVDNQRLSVPEYTEDGTYIAVGDEVRVMEALDGQFKGQLTEKPHRQPFPLVPRQVASRGDYSTTHERTFQEKLRDQVDLSRPIGHVLHRDLQGNDVYEALSNGALEMPDVLPRPKEIRPDSPFADGPEKSSIEVSAEPDLLPESEARRYVGRRVRAVGLSYADVAQYFDEIVGEATQPELDEVLDLLLEESSSESTSAETSSQVAP